MMHGRFRWNFLSIRVLTPLKIQASVPSMIDFATFSINLVPGHAETSAR